MKNFTKNSKVRKISTLIFLSHISLTSLVCFAQQIQYNNQYLVNNFSLSPAYAGNSGYFQAFANYRKSWVGIAGAPESRGVSVNTSILGNMGVGGTIQTEQSGIFRNSTASLSYAYQLKLNDAHSFRFGLGAGILDSRVDLSGSKSINSNDPVITSNQNVHTMLFDATVGVLYKFKNLNVGVAIPRMIESKAKNDAGTLYTLKRHNIIHVSYAYDINKDWQVLPMVVLRKTAASNMFYEVAALGKYKDMMWAGITYRKGSAFAVSVGGQLIGQLIMNYSYEFSGSGMMSQSSGTHEITLGYFIGKNKNAVAPTDSKKPYYEWLNK